ncbi:hypothetical protein FCG40_13005 [Fimbriimonadia bacterium ATM]|nr:hypothetical protein [Armatimonadetes bacterium ATM1]MDL1929892.1 hypothetical protein [Fimbriimonadia bacterium ATM]RIJ94276.1 MAG: hypothetical protein DCC45_12945 [Armatimonadota bacterium]
MNRENSRPHRYFPLAAIALVTLHLTINVCAVVFPNDVTFAALFTIAPQVGLASIVVARMIGISGLLKWVIATEIMMLQALFIVAVRT